MVLVDYQCPANSAFDVSSDNLLSAYGRAESDIVAAESMETHAVDMDEQ